VLGAHIPKFGEGKNVQNFARISLEQIKISKIVGAKNGKFWSTNEKLSVCDFGQLCKSVGTPVLLQLTRSARHIKRGHSDATAQAGYTQ